MPKNTPTSNIIESRIMGARIELVDGLIDLAGKHAQNLEASEGWFNLSTFKEPYRVEGKKVMGYELAERFNWKLPDVIIYPTGGGTGLVGMWKAFADLKELGWLESDTLPRMISVQAQGCAPVVRAIEQGSASCELWQDAHTIATGLCVPKSFADRLILQDIRASNGTAVSVTDGEILRWQAQLAQKEGIFACPEGSATLAGLVTLLKQGTIRRDESIVIFNTGSGLKYICP
jgi:threonine synthase